MVAPTVEQYYFAVGAFCERPPFAGLFFPRTTDGHPYGGLMLFGRRGVHCTSAILQMTAPPLSSSNKTFSLGVVYYAAPRDSSLRSRMTPWGRLRSRITSRGNVAVKDLGGEYLKPSHFFKVKLLVLPHGAKRSDFSKNVTKNVSPTNENLTSTKEVKIWQKTIVN